MSPDYLTLTDSKTFIQECHRRCKPYQISGPITSREKDGETVETVSDYFWGAPKSLQMVTAAMKLKVAYSLEEKL